MLVLADDGIGRINNILSRAIVLLQFVDAQVGILVAQVENVANVGSTERVYTLCIIAYDTKLSVVATQLIDNEVLREVGILLLIDQHIAKEVAVTLCHVGVIAEENVGI